MCDYCGKAGHDWSVHEQARTDVVAWRKEEDAINERQELSGWFADD